MERQSDFERKVNALVDAVMWKWKEREGAPGHPSREWAELAVIAVMEKLLIKNEHAT